MAMTKAERLELETARNELAAAKALGWSGHKAPELLPVPSYPGHTKGWVYNTHRISVERAWSESIAHGYGLYPGADPRHCYGRQDGIRLYATERDALIALRLAAEKLYAEKLADIDAKIAGAGE
jgi:hypothetical protein